MDPFCETINSCQNEFEKIIKNGKYDLNTEMLIAVWKKYNKQIRGVHYSHFFQEEAILDQVLQFFNIARNRTDLVRALLHIYRTKVLSIISNSNTIKPTRKILRGLSNEYVLGVLSNEREFYLNAMLSAAKLSEHLTIILSSEVIGEPKPSVKIFIEALRRLKNIPQEVMYIGDELDTDIIPARNMGMNVILYLPPPEYSQETSWRKYSKDFNSVSHISNISELPLLVKNVNVNIG
jgi:putative hydrolase of the HAD superfamily